MRKKSPRSRQLEPSVLSEPTVQSLLERLEREASARRQAEALLEQKCLELDETSRTLKGELADRQQSEERFRDLTELSSDWYWEQDENFRFTYLSGGILEKAGSRPELSIGKTRWEIPNVVMTGEQWAAHKAVLVAHLPFHDLTYRRMGDDGSVHYVRVSGRPIFDEQGRFRGYRGITKDITDSVLAQDRIQDLSYHAYHDVLTELPNRAMFSQILNQAISKAARHSKGLAVLFIDLDGFKTINDNLGHEAGDALLQEVGKNQAQSAPKRHRGPPRRRRIRSAAGRDQRAQGRGLGGQEDPFRGRRAAAYSRPGASRYGQHRSEHLS